MNVNQIIGRERKTKYKQLNFPPVEFHPIEIIFVLSRCKVKLATFMLMMIFKIEKKKKKKKRKIMYTGGFLLFFLFNLIH